MEQVEDFTVKPFKPRKSRPAVIKKKVIIT